MKLLRIALLTFAGLLAANITCASEVPVAEIQHAAHLGSFIGELLSALAIALVALNMFLEGRHHHKATKVHSYDHLDRAYHDLYATAAVHPAVLDPMRTWNIDKMPQDERLIYEAYVWKVWVVCETIFDQTRQHDDIWQTWKTAIDIEARLHISWILREITYRPDSFKQPLRDWLRKEYGDPETLRRLRVKAIARYAQLRPATELDINQIMTMESLGFAPGIFEQEATFRSRLSTFPEGFLVLTLGSDDIPAGYICTELWSAPPELGDYTGIQLDHSVKATHDPNGTCLYISSQTISPHLRGAALGEFMFRECINLLCTTNPRLSVAYLIVSENWRNARSIYDRCGFELVDQIPHFFKPDNTPPERADVMKCHIPLDWYAH